MKTLKFVLIVLGVILISLVSYYAYMGGFNKVVVQEEELGPFDFVMVERYGDYSQTPYIQDSLMKELAAFQVASKMAFGIYYDNPNNTSKKPEEYHSVVGLVLENADSMQIELLHKNGFRIERMGKTHSTVVHFPKKTNLSVILGIFKAYPALNEYRKAKNYSEVPALELYSRDEIIYAMEVK
jgi:hypothetical protein